MATTANYGWTTPDDTDLVKDGASAIRTLGSAIDTTTKANADLVGLVYLNTTSFSAVASQSINDVFSSTYDAYRIVMDLLGSEASTGLRFRLRVSGSDASGASDYTNPTLYNQQNSSTVATVAGAPSSSGYIGFAGTSYGHTSLDIVRPNKTFTNQFDLSKFFG